MAASSLHPRSLRYLAAVAQTGSIQAAAREVAISASAIDRQLLPLFNKLAPKTRLQVTEKGRLTRRGGSHLRVRDHVQ